MSEQPSKYHHGFSALDIVMLGFGSVIGAGVFVASGAAVRQAGPAVLVAFIIGGIALVGVLSSLAEMSAANPSPGGFRTYARAALGPWMGFTVGWMYWTSGVLTMSSEVTAAALLTQFWLPHVPLWMMSLAYSALVTAMNFMDPRRFGKLEGAMSTIKVLALVAFIGIGGYALLAGRGAGLHELRHAGLGAAAFFPTGLRGLAASLLMVMFSYAGVQVVALAAPETRDTARTMPRAINALTLSLLLLYLAAFGVLVLLVPWHLVSANRSPFVQGLERAGIAGAVGPLMNGIILIAALSALSSAMFGVARMLYALAKDREAPPLFMRQNRFGTPGPALAVSSLVLLVAIILALVLPAQAYLLITGASGFVSMFNWLVIAITHLRYRPLLLRANPNGLPFRAPGYPWLNLITLGIVGLILLTTPLGAGQTAGLVAGVIQFGLISLVYLLGVRPRLLREGGGRMPRIEITAPCTVEPRPEDNRLRT